MKEIKFRGYSHEVEQWCYGSLDLSYYASDGEAVIIEHGESKLGFNVDPSSVGQFTGLQDKNGKDIYEGDVVWWDDCSGGEHYRIGIVKINPDIQFDCSAGLSYNGIKSSSNFCFSYGNFAYKDTHNHLQVIGNQFDNRELLTDKTE